MGKLKCLKKKYKKIFVISLLIIFLLTFLFLLKSSGTWIVEGDKVYIDDSYVYISAEPSTITEKSWVYFNLTSKVYSGNIDLTLGFDTEKLIPQKAELYNPHNVTYSYICETGIFNYTLSPRYFWCYKNFSNNITSELRVIKEGNFEIGNLSSKTVYWNVTEEWKDVSGVFESINYNYGGMNKWWYIRNIPIISNKSYKFRVLMDFQRKGFSPEPVDSKYWFAIKPSSETIQQAISNNHLYALDPWVNSSGKNQNKDYLNTDLVGTWTFTTDGRDISTFGNNCTGNAVYTSSGGIINGYYEFTKASSQYLTCMNGTALRPLQNFSYGVWFKATGDESQVIVMPRSTVVTGNNFIWSVYTDGTVFDSYIKTDVSGRGMQTPISEAGLINRWILWFVTYNGTTFCNYVNGTLRECVGQTGIFSTIWTGAPNLSIGYYNFGSSFMNGGIDNIAIWNRTLNSSEASDYWNNGLGIEYNSTQLDAVKPNINITFPTNNSNFSNLNLDVNFTRSDETGLSVCWYSNDTYLKNTTLTSCGNITNVVWTEAKHNVTIWVNDTNNNINSSKISFTIDTVKPNINITFPINNTNWTNLNLDVNYTRSDNRQLFNCWYSNDTYLKNTTLASCGNITSIVWSEAKHNVTIWANDSAGNINSSRISFTVRSQINNSYIINQEFSINNKNINKGFLSKLLSQFFNINSILDKLRNIFIINTQSLGLNNVIIKNFFGSKLISQSLLFNLISERIRLIPREVIQSFNINLIFDKLRIVFSSISQSFNINLIFDKLRIVFSSISQSFNINTILQKFYSFFRGISSFFSMIFKFDGHYFTYHPIGENVTACNVTGTTDTGGAGGGKCPIIISEAKRDKDRSYLLFIIILLLIFLLLAIGVIIKVTKYKKELKRMEY